MHSRTDTGGRTKAFIYLPSHGPQGGGGSAPAQVRFKPPTNKNVFSMTSANTNCPMGNLGVKKNG